MGPRAGVHPIDKIVKADRLYSPREIAESLRVSQATISRAIRAGKLKAFRVGNQWRLLGADVVSYVNTGTQAALNSANGASPSQDHAGDPAK